MVQVRYPQFCALARAAEVIGERWTLLIARELLLGPKRFTDLHERLDGISPSVLVERLRRAEQLALVQRAVLPPPAASTVYELTEHGRALEAAILELIRWGGRYLFPARDGDRFEPEWARLALAACARRGPSPQRTIRLQIQEGEKAITLHVVGGPEGTIVSDTAASPAEASLVTSIQTLLGLIGGALLLKAAIAGRHVAVTGDVSALNDLPRLFEVNAGRTELGGPEARRSSGRRGSRGRGGRSERKRRSQRPARGNAQK